MRRAFAVLFALQACSPTSREAAPSGQAALVLEVSDSAATEFYRTVADEYNVERTAIRAAGRHITRAPGVLRITPRRGPVRSLADTIVDGDRHLRYVYHAFVPQLDAHVVREQYYEGSAYRLISDNTGRDTLLAAPPLVSPDGRRFVVASLDLDAFYSPNTLQVWRGTPGRLVREFEVDGSERWGPDSVSWSSSDTLRFQRVTREGGDFTDRYFPHILIRRDSAWIIEPPLP